MDDDRRHGKDEMNLAVLPIAKLGRSDTRNSIEYYGTFTEKGEQREMIWTVHGADKIGLPGELGERVLVALLYIAAEDGFQNRRMEFSLYQVLQTLGLADGGRNYRGVEQAIAQIAGILVTSENAWVQKTKDGKLRRSRVSKGFHIIDDYTLWNLEDTDERKSYVVWGERIWNNIKAGYIKNLDIDFYYSLRQPLARRMYRFLDKMTHYRPSKPYTIDIFALANKLGMAPHEYPSYVKRLLKRGADELVERGWLSDYEFTKSGDFHRIRFYRCEAPAPVQLELLDRSGGNEPDPWLDILAEMSANIAEHLIGTELVGIENGVATIRAKAKADWLNNRMAKSVARELTLSGHEVNEAIFVE
jgi:hypothetical protein